MPARNTGGDARRLSVHGCTRAALAPPFLQARARVYTLRREREREASMPVLPFCLVDLVCYRSHQDVGCNLPSCRACAPLCTGNDTHATGPGRHSTAVACTPVPPVRLYTAQCHTPHTYTVTVLYNCAPFTHTSASHLRDLGGRVLKAALLLCCARSTHRARSDQRERSGALASTRADRSEYPAIPPASRLGLRRRSPALRP